MEKTTLYSDADALTVSVKKTGTDREPNYTLVMKARLRGENGLAESVQFEAALHAKKSSPAADARTSDRILDKIDKFNFLGKGFLRESDKVSRSKISASPDEILPFGINIKLEANPGKLPEFKKYFPEDGVRARWSDDRTVMWHDTAFGPETRKVFFDDLKHSRILDFDGRKGKKELLSLSKKFYDLTATLRKKFDTELGEGHEAYDSGVTTTQIDELVGQLYNMNVIKTLDADPKGYALGGGMSRREQR